MLSHFQPLLNRLLAIKKPLDLHLVASTTQLIHGDLTGNVLFDRPAHGSNEHRSAPGIIDLTLYRKPADYAEAIIVADGLAWYGQGRELANAYLDLDFEIEKQEGSILFGHEINAQQRRRREFRVQLLIRALYWRMLTFAIDTDMDWVMANLGRSDHEAAVDVIEKLVNDDKT